MSLYMPMQLPTAWQDSELVLLLQFIQQHRRERVMTDNLRRPIFAEHHTAGVDVGDLFAT